MTERIVARRYTRALFTLARKQGMAKLDKIAEDFAALKAVFKNTPALVNLYRSPLFSVMEKGKVTREILGKLGADADTLNFCSLLAEKRRLNYLQEIISLFCDLLDAEKGILRGELITAVAIVKNKQATVLKQLEQQAGRSLDLAFFVDPGIIGGVTLKVGDRVLDSSLRAQLSFLKENIKRGV